MSTGWGLKREARVSFFRKSKVEGATNRPVVAMMPGRTVAVAREVNCTFNRMASSGESTSNQTRGPSVRALSSSPLPT